MNDTLDPARLYPLGALFFVLLACIWFAIEQTELRKVNRVLAPAATLLCMVAMVIPVRSVEQHSLIETVYIPWAALGCSVLCVLFLGFLTWLYQWLSEGSERHHKYSSHPEHGKHKPNANQQLHRGDSQSIQIKR